MIGLLKCTRFEEILKEPVVGNGLAGFDFNYHPGFFVKGIYVETFIGFPIFTPGNNLG